jgi:hypothetical protein
MTVLATAMTTIRKKRRLSVHQAWHYLNRTETFTIRKPIWEAARARGSTESWITHAQAYCKSIVEATSPPPDVSKWAERLDDAQFLAAHGYEKGGKPKEPQALKSVEIARY